MATHRVRLFVLPFNPKPSDHPEEAPGFAIEADGDDAARDAIRKRLSDFGYKTRSVSALAGAKPGEPTYAATVENPKDSDGSSLGGRAS